MIHSPGKTCTEERQGGKQSKVAILEVHSRGPFERGSDKAAPLARVDGLAPRYNQSFPTAGRQAIFLGATKPRATRPKGAAARSWILAQAELAERKISSQSRARLPGPPPSRCQIRVSQRVPEPLPPDECLLWGFARPRPFEVTRVGFLSRLRDSRV